MGMDHRKLRKQLEAQAAALETLQGKALAEHVLSAAAALLKAAGDETGGLQEMDERTFEELFACYSPIIRQSERFLTQAIGRTGVQQGCEKLASLEKELAEAQRRVRELPDKIRTANHQIAEFRMRESKLEAEYARTAKTGKELKDVCEELQSEINQYSSERLAEMQSHNDALESELNEHRTRHDNLLERWNTMQKELKLLADQNNQLEGMIKSQPDECAALRDIYSGLEKRLHDLETAREECSPEKQTALQREIDALQESVEILTAQKSQLETIYHSWQNSRVVLDTDAETFKDGILERLRVTTEELIKIAPERLAYLTELRQKTDQIEESLAQCQKLHKKYSGWLAADQCNLNSICRKSKSDSESRHLRKTLADKHRTEIEAQLKKVRDDLEMIRTDLEQLDERLRNYIPVVELDRREAYQNANRL